MKPLSEYVDDELVKELQQKIEQGEFPGIRFQHAMEFLLSDGILPESGLPTASFLKLEDWVRGRHSC